MINVLSCGIKISAEPFCFITILAFTDGRTDRRLSRGYTVRCIRPTCSRTVKTVRGGMSDLYYLLIGSRIWLSIGANISDLEWHHDRRRMLFLR